MRVTGHIYLILAGLASIEQLTMVMGLLYLSHCSRRLRISLNVVVYLRILATLVVRGSTGAREQWAICWSIYYWSAWTYNEMENLFGGMFWRSESLEHSLPGRLEKKRIHFFLFSTPFLILNFPSQTPFHINFSYFKGSFLIGPVDQSTSGPPVASSWVRKFLMEAYCKLFQEVTNGRWRQLLESRLKKIKTPWFLTWE